MKTLWKQCIVIAIVLKLNDGDDLIKGTSAYGYFFICTTKDHERVSWAKDRSGCQGHRDAPDRQGLCHTDGALHPAEGQTESD